MKRLIVAMLAAGAIGMFPNPSPADAQSTKLVKCMNEAVASCDEDFKGDGWRMTSIRGWCYMIRTGMCYKA